MTNLRFADDIDLLRQTRGELLDLTQRLDATSQKYGMEVSGGKSKIMVASRNDNGKAHDEITMNGEALEEVTSFKYLGGTITTDVTSESEVKKRRK